MTAQERPQRGRPRPEETKRRDETILQLLRDNPSGLLRNNIAELMNLNKSKTYLSLDRLRKQGLAEKVHPTVPPDDGSGEPQVASRADKDTLWKAVKTKPKGS